MLPNILIPRHNSVIRVMGYLQLEHRSDIRLTTIAYLATETFTSPIPVSTFTSMTVSAPA